MCLKFYVVQNCVDLHNFIQRNCVNKSMSWELSDKVSVSVFYSQRMWNNIFYFTYLFKEKLTGTYSFTFVLEL